MRVFVFLFACVTTVASAQFTNHKLADPDGSSATAGASVAVSPRNNKVIVAYAGGKVLYSIDAGANWKPSSVDMSKGIFGTPILNADSKGNFYLTYSTDRQLVCRHSGDDGKTFGDPVSIGSTPGKDAFNPVATTFGKESILVTWSQSDSYGSEAADCKSSLFTSHSSGGKKWSKPVQLNEKDGACKGAESIGGSAAGVSFDDKTFVIWSSGDKMFFDRSYDGDQWLSSDIQFGKQTGSRFESIPGFGMVNSVGTISIDNSPSRIHGTIFYAFSDMKSGDDDSDIWMMRTVTRGDTWTQPTRINQDQPGTHQFMPRITVDPANGFVYILFYDRRNHEDDKTDVYLAYSLDGGNQFKEKKINDQSFTADLSGDNTLYNFISLCVQKGMIVPVWTSVNNGKQEVWTAPIRHEELVK